MILIRVIDVPSIIAFAGLDIILFLVGMMIVIGFLEERKFFEQVVDGILGRVGTSGTRLVVVLMLLSALFAALVDEVTSILFMAATVFQITAKKGLKPVPFLMMVVFATNIGSSATVVGNPVGVMVALRGGLTFSDFLRWATPISLATLALAIPLSLLYFDKEVKALDAALKEAPIVAEAPEVAAAANGGEALAGGFPRRLWGSAALFVGTLIALVAHSYVEALLGLAKNSMLVGTSLIAAGIALSIDRTRAREIVERRVDWWTLSFFLTLFASVGALQLTGVTSRVAGGLVALAGDDPSLLFLFFIWVVGGLSAFMDNVLAVAMFIPIVSDLGASGFATAPMWWAVLFGGTLFGNLTMIGSTANIVAIGMLERRGLGNVTFREWIKPGAFISIPTLALASLLLYLQFYF
jgi:Na+/H+ antiporter NhaD/arsenite permease-like protein